MGKRKERRLAAKIGANRRVKLDLFAEPSGEMVETSVQSEIGGDPVKGHNVGVPTSPSSSGPNPENPLLLLGQYSDDDDLDEETSKRAKHVADGSPSALANSKIQEPIKVEESLGVDTEKETVNGDIKQEPNQTNVVKEPDDNNNKEIDSSTYVEHLETIPKTHANNLDPSGVSASGDLAGGWKMVMHEESNQYYYWNTVTGETSWVVPTILLGEQTAPLGIDGTSSNGDIHSGTISRAEAATYAYAAVDEQGGSTLTSGDLVEYSTVSGINGENGNTVLPYDANQGYSHYCTSVAGAYVDPSASSNFGAALQTHGVTEEHLTASVAEHQSELNGCNEFSRLVEFSESLIRRLEALNRSGHRLEEQELVVKEIEIRISDCKALLSYGSSLLPFWWHCEAQLKKIDSVITNGEIYLSVVNNTTRKDEEYSLQKTETGSEAIKRDKDTSSTKKNSPSSPDATKVQMESLETEGVIETHRSSGGEEEPEIVLEADSKAVSGQLGAGIDSHADEDVDMDVEMEVDDDISTEDVQNAECSLASEQLSCPDQESVKSPPLPSDELSIPPPPEEEWIPPPPPDSEAIAPPPSEEPPPSSVPPSYPDITLYAPYTDQYSMGYAVPSVDYYAPTTVGMTDVGYYAPVDVSTTLSQTAIYYDPLVASALPEGVVGGSSVSPAAYYDISSVSVPSTSVGRSAESSGYYIQSGPISYQGSVPAHAGSADLQVESGSSSIPVRRTIEPVQSAVISKSYANKPSSVSSTVQPVGDSVHNGTAKDQLSTAALKNQTQVIRKKKHTVSAVASLRSNKKVSSLVDKWKAAKEELHGDEEEPKNEYEAMEKKRQKEIEEWKARQIASGEAQDNANFLPLGGDWRERVKRKRAQERKEAKKEAAQTPVEAADKGTKQPDLVELSKDLPKGWQAYWDESTKEVYYGNKITTETTWTRPKT